MRCAGPHFQPNSPTRSEPPGFHLPESGASDPSRQPELPSIGGPQKDRLGPLRQFRVVHHRARRHLAAPLT
jgi:hypothetical protein